MQNILHKYAMHEVSLFKYVHIINNLRALTGKEIDLVEDGQLRECARESAEADNVLIYERKAKG